MTTLETDTLAELISQKLTCLTKLLEMGKKQLELVGAGSITELLDVLAFKQRVIEELQRVEASLDPFRGQDPSTRRWNTPQKQRQCASQLQQCEALLGEIVNQEKKSEKSLIRRRDAVAVELQEVHLASQARGAYASESLPEGSRLDLLSDS